MLCGVVTLWLLVPVVFVTPFNEYYSKELFKKKEFRDNYEKHLVENATKTIVLVGTVIGEVNRTLRALKTALEETKALPKEKLALLNMSSIDGANNTVTEYLTGIEKDITHLLDQVFTNQTNRAIQHIKNASNLFYEGLNKTLRQKDFIVQNPTAVNRSVDDLVARSSNISKHWEGVKKNVTDVWSVARFFFNRAADLYRHTPGYDKLDKHLYYDWVNFSAALEVVFEKNLELTKSSASNDIDKSPVQAVVALLQNVSENAAKLERSKTNLEEKLTVMKRELCEFQTKLNASRKALEGIKKVGMVYAGGGVLRSDKVTKIIAEVVSTNRLTSANLSGVENVTSSPRYANKSVFPLLGDAGEKSKAAKEAVEMSGKALSDAEDALSSSRSKEGNITDALTKTQALLDNATNSFREISTSLRVVAGDAVANACNTIVVLSVSANETQLVENTLVKMNGLTHLNRSREEMQRVNKQLSELNSSLMNAEMKAKNAHVSSLYAGALVKNASKMAGEALEKLLAEKKKALCATVTKLGAHNVTLVNLRHQLGQLITNVTREEARAAHADNAAMSVTKSSPSAAPSAASARRMHRRAARLSMVVSKKVTALAGASKEAMDVASEHASRIKTTFTEALHNISMHGIPSQVPVARDVCDSGDNVLVLESFLGAAASAEEALTRLISAEETVRAVEDVRRVIENLRSLEDRVRAYADGAVKAEMEARRLAAEDAKRPECESLDTQLMRFLGQSVGA
ncbi:hypothetical protein, conserved in T. vivax [Trypanosoma vivax Y486]|uniref:Uncharacterized protein n=1 Tax=Trypanosoma vivax (strain Y486) TaxID=1055687 RepID=F9WVS5_TRYVY|nr:hypothetical protein, conserved in T. vivax [Trypanosoma vivax Y486]|eukprot:CCD21685.1 hypothetical protein, conserved in T. vivax [Trypanosoma vivax Y486]